MELKLGQFGSFVGKWRQGYSTYPCALALNANDCARGTQRCAAWGVFIMFMAMLTPDELPKTGLREAARDPRLFFGRNMEIRELNVDFAIKMCLDTLNLDPDTHDSTLSLLKSLARSETIETTIAILPLIV